ncbi:MAG TPA: hypothetical protein ENN67_07145, partial [Firmicutes bacterium]|nr:hypothetical protein [Bacillota bacterium]
RPDIAFPGTLVDEIIRETGDYISDIDLLRGESPDVSDPDTCFGFVEQVQAALETRIGALKCLMEKHPTDFTAVVLETPDRLCHLFYKILVIDENYPKPEKWELELRDRMIGVLGRMDELIGEIVSGISDDDLLVIMSDHGFGPLDEILKMNRFLHELGFLQFKPEVDGSIRRKLGRALPESVKAPLRLIFSRPGKLGEGAHRDFNPYALIEWSKTKAYSGGSTEQGIFINVERRDPHGIVMMGAEYHSVRENLIDALRKSKHPVTGEQLFDWVEPRENIYSGEYLENAPDIMFELMGYKAVVGEDAEPPLIGPWSQPRAGYHRRDGILIMKGPMVQSSVKIENARIEDIAPTILACWGLKSDESMNGAVLNDAIKPEFIEAHPPAKDNFDELADKSGERVCREDSEEMEDLLKGLGYLN